MNTSAPSCANFILGDAMKEFCCGAQGAGGLSCNGDDYHGCQQTFFKMGGMCKAPCDYDGNPVAMCPFEDASFCDTLSAMNCDPSMPSVMCQEAVAAYCCADGSCTQE